MRIGREIDLFSVFLSLDPCEPPWGEQQHFPSPRRGLILQNKLALLLLHL